MTSKSLALLSLLLLGACATAPRNEARTPPDPRARYADALMALIPAETLVWQLSLPHAAAFGPHQRQATAHDAFMRNVDMEAVEAVLREALLRHFTEDELRALLSFCSTPEGRACLAKTAPFVVQVVPGCAREAAKAWGRTATERGAGGGWRP